jgi:hypothetical protein
MSDFMMCVAAVGGNKQEVVDYVTSRAKDSKAGKVEGAGKGVVISGSGALSLDAGTEREIARLLNTKYFSGGVSACQKALEMVEKKISYTEPQRRSDIRTVSYYLGMNGQNEGALNSSGCGRIPVTNTTDLKFEGPDLLSTNTTRAKTDCADSAFIERTTSSYCRANLAELDEVVIPSSDGSAAVNVRVRCLSGQCVTCNEIVRWQTQAGEWKDNSRLFRGDYLVVHVSSNGGISGMEPLGGFLRSLSRVIGRGDDAAFCQRAPAFCKS